MKYNLLMFFMVVTMVTIGALSEGGGDIEELLSRSFSEIALTNGNSLLVKTKDIDHEMLYVRQSEQGRFHTVSNGSILVVEKGKTFCFRYSRTPCMKLSLLDAAEAGKRFPQAPDEFKQGEGLVLVFEDGPSVTLISSKLNISYAIGDKGIKKFPFPFRGIWRDEGEYDRWCVGKPYRGRLLEVENKVQSEKADAELIVEFVKTRFAKEIDAMLLSQNSQKAEVVVQLDREGPVRRFGKALIQIGMENKRRFLSGLYLFTIRGEGLEHQYLFDSVGHVRWHFSRDNAKRNKDGLFIGSEGLSLFELDAAGKVCRAYYGNVLPLLIVTDRTFFFTGEKGLIRKFFTDWRNASGSFGVKPNLLRNK